MGMPVTTNEGGICFAFPDVCLTPAPPGSPVPIPYPNIGQLSSADGTASTVLVGGSEVVTTDSEISSTSGDEAGTSGGVVVSGAQGGPVTFPQGSGTVFAEGNPVVRMFDPTEQNDGNAVGMVLGGNPTVLVGG